MRYEEARLEADLKAAMGTPYSVIQQGEEYMAFPYFKGIQGAIYHSHHKLPTKKVTFVIPAYNERERLPQTLRTLFASVDRESVSVIVVQDGSTDVEYNVNPYLNEYPEVRMFWNAERRGVGYSFDVGVSHAETEQLFIMGADITFIDNGWMEPFLERVKTNDDAIICVMTGQLNAEHTEPYENMPKYYGAKVLWENVKVKPENEYRRHIEAQWKGAQGDGIQEVGCVLGAFYGINKSFYEHIDGFKGHRQWGTLEPLISMRTWLHGGRCLVDKDTLVCHQFLKVGSPKTMWMLVFNKLLVGATMLREDYQRKLFEWAMTLDVRGMKGQYSGGVGEGAITMYGRCNVARELEEKYKRMISDDQIYSRLQKSGIFDV